MMVFLVWSLIKFVAGVAYWIGLPYYWNSNKPLATVLVTVGNWILVNVVFNYYKALVTPPGNPPSVKLSIFTNKIRINVF